MNPDQMKQVGVAARNIKAILGSVDLLINGDDNPLTETRDALVEAYADMSPSMQSTPRGQKTLDDMTGLDSAIDTLQDAQIQLEMLADALKVLLGD